jgi:hypothetical protein
VSVSFVAAITEEFAKAREQVKDAGGAMAEAKF